VDHISDTVAGILQVCGLFEPEQMQLEEKLTAISLKESVRQILALNSIRSLRVVNIESRGGQVMVFKVLIK
jgi:hypothetical protein